MGKNKLQKFSDMETFGCVLQYPRHILIEKGFPFKGKWNSEFFSRSNPITLELGCGKGEYTVGLAEANPDRNYICLLYTSTSPRDKRHSRMPSSA